MIEIITAKNRLQSPDLNRWSPCHCVFFVGRKQDVFFYLIFATKLIESYNQQRLVSASLPFSGDLFIKNGFSCSLFLELIELLNITTSTNGEISHFWRKKLDFQILSFSRSLFLFLFPSYSMYYQQKNITATTVYNQASFRYEKRMIFAN